MRRLLVPLDGSAPSERALSFVMETFPDAHLVLLHVIDPAKGVGVGVGGPGASEAWYEASKERAGSELAAAAARVEAAGMSVETVIETGRPASTVVEYAEEHDIDHVVMGSHGREGVSRLLLGSVAEAVVRRSPVPVTVVRYANGDDDEHAVEADDTSGSSDANDAEASDEDASDAKATNDDATDRPTADGAVDEEA